MNVQAASESPSGTGCPPEHRAQLSHLNPQLVFRSKSIRFTYVWKMWLFANLNSLNLAGVMATASLLGSGVLRNESVRLAARARGLSKGTGAKGLSQSCVFASSHGLFSSSKGYFLMTDRER